MKRVQRCGLGVLLAAAVLLPGAAQAQCAAPYPNGTQQDFDFLLSTFDDILGLVLLDTATNVNLWTGIDNDTGLPAVPAVTPIWQSIPGQVDSQFFNRDNDGNGIDDDDHLDLLAAVLDGDASVVAGLNGATVTDIRNDFAANRALITTFQVTINGVNIQASALGGLVSINQTISVTTGAQSCINVPIIGNQCFDVPSLWGAGGLLQDSHPVVGVLLERYLIDLGAAIMTTGEAEFITWYQDLIGNLTLKFIQVLVPRLLENLKAEEGASEFGAGDDKFTCSTSTIVVNLGGLVLGGVTIDSGAVTVPGTEICSALVTFVNRFNCTNFACNASVLSAAGNLNASGGPNITSYTTTNGANRNRQIFMTNEGLANVPLQIAAQPVNVGVLSGASATLAATIAGTPTGASWAVTDTTSYAIGTQVATTQTLSYPYAVPSNSGTFSVVICDSRWVRRSTPATLAVGFRPLQFIQQPTPPTATALVGANQNFAVQVVGGVVVPTYQWRFGVAPINGGSNPSALTNLLQLTNIQTSNAGTYNVQVTGQDTPGVPITLTSNNATLSVIELLVIGSQPSGANLAVGGNHTLTVGGITGGTGNPVTYQWQKNGVPILGATSNSYALNGVVFTDQASYRCIVTDPTPGFSQSVASNTVQVTVLGIPAAFNLPLFVSRPIGGNFQLTVFPVGGAVASPGTEASPPDPAQYTYVWEFDQNPIDGNWVTLGATSNSVSFVNAQATDAGKYRVRVSDTALVEVTSTESTVSVSSNPIVVGTQPQGAGRLTGQSVTFNVSATGGAPVPDTLTFVWWFTNPSIALQPLPIGGNVSVLNTGTTSAVTITNVNPAARQGTYFCRIQDAQGQTIDSNTVSLFVGTAPAITVNPVGGNFYTGSGLVLSVTATGGVGPLTYSWTQSGLPVGTNSPTLDLSPLTPLKAGSYVCTVHDVGVGDGDPSTYTPTVRTSTAAAVQVVAPLQILGAGQPQGVLADPGDDVTFSVTAIGGYAPLSYQWYRADNSPIGGATTSSYSVNDVEEADEDGFYCIVTDTVMNPDVAVQSATAALLVTEPADPLVIVDNPDNVEATTGDSAFLGVAATGGITGGYTYQWRKNGVDIPSAVSPVLIFTSLEVDDAGNYDCVVTDNTQQATSSPATVIVTEPAATPVAGGLGLVALSAALAGLTVLRRRR